MRAVLGVLVAAMMLFAGACQPAGQKIAGGDLRLAGEGSAGYLDRVSSQPTVTQADAFTGILLLLEAKPAEATFAQAAGELQKRRMRVLENSRHCER
jgi:hypothetical protein